jgi:hypothetical protein
MWRPISEAPKDGATILGYKRGFFARGDYRVVRWATEDEAAGYDGYWDMVPGVTAWTPTHWMPLPEPPKGEPDGLD